MPPSARTSAKKSVTEKRFEVLYTKFASLLPNFLNASHAKDSRLTWEVFRTVNCRRMFFDLLQIKLSFSTDRVPVLMLIGVNFVNDSYNEKKCLSTSFFPMTKMRRHRCH